MAQLAIVDQPSSPVEWIVSVSMLTEGWDVKNVFQIYPHEKRAFNSKLLAAQVLGRGLRRPAGVVAEPRVFVFNHQKWAPEDLVIRQEGSSTPTAKPAEANPRKHATNCGVQSARIATDGEHSPSCADHVALCPANRCGRSPKLSV